MKSIKNNTKYYDMFINIIQQEKMRELWDNEDNAVWDNEKN